MSTTKLTFWHVTIWYVTFWHASIYFIIICFSCYYEILLNQLKYHKKHLIHLLTIYYTYFMSDQMTPSHLITSNKKRKPFDFLFYVLKMLFSTIQLLPSERIVYISTLHCLELL